MKFQYLGLAVCLSLPVSLTVTGVVEAQSPSCESVPGNESLPVPPAFALAPGHEADASGRAFTPSSSLPSEASPSPNIPPETAVKSKDATGALTAVDPDCAGRKFDSMIPSPWTADSAGMTAPEYQFLDELNADRDSSGLPGLAANGVLAGIARQRSQQLAVGGVFTHYASDGSLAFANMLNSAAFPYIFAGENLASNNYAWGQSLDVANTQLMNSPDHRAAILNTRFNEVGVGIAGPDGRGRFFYTQIFAEV
jgi:uncharacterized protein YkwD